MANTIEIAGNLTRILDIEVKTPYSVDQLVKDAKTALRVGEFLFGEIDAIELGEPGFCDSGLDALKDTYNKLCKRFPELAEKVCIPYLKNA